MCNMLLYVAKSLKINPWNFILRHKKTDVFYITKTKSSTTIAIYWNSTSSNISLQLIFSINKKFSITLYICQQKANTVLTYASHQYVFRHNMFHLWLGVCRKLKVGLRYAYTSHGINQTVQKYDICSDGFRTETACSPQFKLKVTKNNFTCTIRQPQHHAALLSAPYGQVTFNVQIKNVLKPVSELTFLHVMSWKDMHMM